MAVVYSPNVVEIALIHSYGGRTAVNVWHMERNVEIGDPAWEDVVEDFVGNWQDHVLERLSNQVAFIRADWRSLDPGDNTVGTTLPIGGKATNGGQPGPPGPPNLALLVHKNTSNRPRGRRDGRSYLVGVDESTVDQTGTYLNAARVATNTQLQNFYDGISDISTFAWGDQWPVVLETTPASRAPGNTPVVIGARRVTSITVDPLIATQRDRLR